MLREAVQRTALPAHSADAVSGSHPFSELSGALGRTLDRLRRAWSNHLAVDLGTSSTRIFLPGSGLVLNEPSVIAFNRECRELVAAGSEAKMALGRQASAISIVQPLKGGVIADFDAAELMLSFF